MSAEHLPDEIHVRHVVPVIAVVERSTRTVTRVIVENERIRYDDVKVLAEPGNPPATPADLAAINDAIDIAETVAWPRWEFGW